MQFDPWQMICWKRWRAQRNLFRIAHYSGADLPPVFNPATVDEFRQSWGEEIDEVNRTGKFRMDDQINPFDTPVHARTGRPYSLRIIFMSEKQTSKITKLIISSKFDEFLRSVTPAGTDVSTIERIGSFLGIQLIFVSYAKLDGSAKNEIVDYNTFLEFPIRHFTVNELQVDPTIVSMAPRLVERLNAQEVQALIDRQTELLVGQKRIAPGFKKKLESMNDPVEQEAYVKEINAEMLSKLPTININDPMVKWRGFNIDEVLVIYRDIGLSPVDYKLVVPIERTPLKPPKVIIQTTNL